MAAVKGVEKSWTVSFQGSWEDVMNLQDELGVQTSLNGRAACTSKMPQPLFYCSSVGITIKQPFISYKLVFP